MTNGSGDIIIKGGSVELEYEESEYPPVSGKTHKNDNKKLTRILVTDRSGNPVYDTGEHSGGLKDWTVKAFCK